MAIEYLIKSILILEKLGSPDAKIFASHLAEIREEISEEKFNEILKKLDKK